MCVCVCVCVCACARERDTQTHGHTDLDGNTVESEVMLRRLVAIKELRSLYFPLRLLSVMAHIRVSHCTHTNESWHT